MARKPGPGEASGYFAAVAGANYVQLTTFRRGGRAVATPVHIVTAGDVAFFRTSDVAGKAKRLRHTSAVRVAPSTFRGRPRGPAIRAEAYLLEGEHGRLIPWCHRRRGWTTQQYRLERPRAAN
jgi:PPOX class probable F420-dependent enzyme